jgi:putative GTP pyrophosphokinase
MQEQADTPDVERAWLEHPDALRQFINTRANYQALCDEVAYILQKRLAAKSVRYAAVTKRAKSLHSFAEKIARKSYKNPFDDVTDLAGVRVVFLYKQDRSVIEKVIQTEFEVLEKIDKTETRDADSFGYGALHYLVHIGKKSSGARYEDLKELVCEIQVRTVLQDAWAIFDQHLRYKQEADVPKVLRRKINSLAGLFETADDNFDQLSRDRQAYLKRVKSNISTHSKRTQPLDLDSFSEFLHNRFRSLPSGPPDFTSRSLQNLRKYGYKTFADLDDLLARTRSAREAMATEKPPPRSASQINRAIALDNPAYRQAGWKPSLRALFRKYDHLVKKGQK